MVNTWQQFKVYQTFYLIAAAERYHDSIKTMTRLLEDKREPQQRKKFLGIF